MDKTIIIAAGGTGGHLYPGIALGRVLKKRGCKVIFIVKQNDSGKDILVTENFHYREIPASGMPRKISLKIFNFFIDLIKGLLYAGKIIRELKPNAVIGMGGYISFPAVINAKILGIKTIIHEQNVFPGVSNRLLGLAADKVTVAFEETAEYFSRKKTVVTGNPLREELFKVPYAYAVKKLGLSQGIFTVLIFGGSQGAAKVNRVIVKAWENLDKLKGQIQFIHLAGKKDFDWVNSEYKKKNIPGEVFPYMNDIGNAYSVSDLVIARSGAMTISELMILDKPSILIPFPFAAENHQEYNARMLEKRGKAKVVLENNITAESIAQEILSVRKTFSGHNSNFKIPEVLPQEVLADIVANI